MARRLLGTRRQWLRRAALAPFWGAAVSAGELPRHHSPKGGFRNLPGPGRPRGNPVAGLVRWSLGLGPDEAEHLPRAQVPPYAPARAEPDVAALHAPADLGNFQVTWIGHATFLIQHRGRNILTDPIWSDRASPVSFAGPRRHSPPGVPLGSLPPIDLVLQSHNHYDHLDRDTVLALGTRPRYLAPLGVAAWYRELGITQVSEHDWWQSVDLGDGLVAHCVPAQHFSGRGVTDRNDTLWCGWVLESPEGNCYFAGDTGYGSFGQAIGTRLGPMRLSLIPIGAYRPRWFMKPVHVDPIEAVQLHRDVGSQRSLGMHWGTFKLTDEPMGEPPLVLARAAAAAGLAPDEFTVLKFGETLRV